MGVPGHADDKAALVDVPVDEVQLGVAGRTLLAIFGVRVAVLHAGELAGVDRHGVAVAALNEQHRPLHALNGRDRAVMQPCVADGLADDDPIAGPVRRRPVERLEDHFGTVQPPELVLRFPCQGVQLDALGVAQRLDTALNGVAIDAAALDRLPLRDDPRAGFGLRRVAVNEPVAVVGVEARPDAPGAQILGRPGLPLGRLAHGGLHVDARLDRLRLAERVARRRRLGIGDDRPAT
jgi:hypothetical protein